LKVTIQEKASSVPATVGDPVLRKTIDLQEKRGSSRSAPPSPWERGIQVIFSSLLFRFILLRISDSKPDCK
jgi:hypothetical protein